MNDVVEIPPVAPDPIVAPQGPVVCPDGWIRYQESCYYIEIEKMDLPRAERACNEKGATMFVANSIEEFNQVMKEAPLYYWSWIGLGQGPSDVYPKWQVAGEPAGFRCAVASDVGPVSWNGGYGLDPRQLKWLVTPFSSGVNGWSSAATCVAYYNTDVYSSTYVYFYPCSSLYHSVCERNATLARY